MGEAFSGLIWLRDPCLAPLALAPLPAWAWSLDGARILWANPTGAAIFGATTLAALAACRFEASDLARQVAQLAASLPADGSHQIEQLRGCGAGVGGALTCRCTHVRLADGTEAMLVASTEHAGPDLPLAEQVERLLGDSEVPVAAFTTDGALIHATAAAQRHLAGARTLAALGAEPQAEATASHAVVDTAAGRVAIDRLGPVLFASFEAAPAPAEPGERHRPLRFVWQIDAEGRFTLDSQEFAALVGAEMALGRTWQELSTTLGLDPDGQVERALSTRDTWSGLAIGWPVGDGARLWVELSGLPVFDRERRFRGYRGFGICRDLERLNALARRVATKATPPIAPAPPSAERRAVAETAAAALTTDRTAPGACARAEIETPAAEESATARAIGPILDRLPVGVLIYRHNDLIYANRVFLRWTGYGSVAALARAGGIESLLIGSGSVEPGEAPFTIMSSRGESMPAESRLFSVPWEGDKAFALITTPATAAPAPTMPASESAALQDARAEIAELRAILDTESDGIVVLDNDLRIVSANRSAQALFGADPLVGTPFAELFAPADAKIALAHVAGLSAGATGGAIEVSGRPRQGDPIALSMTIERLGSGRLCAVLRDLTPSKQSESELVAAHRRAERQSSAKSEFLAKISHEIRNPLNAIIGFSELMMEERFGAIGNDRYRQYLKDIHASGGHVMSLVNDLLDLSKIEAGRLDLAFTGVALNDLVEQSVALMQPQASRERVIVRTSLAPRLPQVTADARSLRQIVLNLVANSIRLTEAGGQVIVSTARTDDGAVILRVRDTGVGMGDEELATAFEPFRQVATRSGAGIGLPLSKALAEANGASLRIDSRRGSGTLVEVTFPREHVVE